MIKLLAYTHIWIAMGAAAAAAATAMAIGPHSQWSPMQFEGMGLVMLATGGAYTAQRLIKLQRDPGQIPWGRRQFLDRWKGVLIVWWIGLAAGGWAWGGFNASIWMEWARQHAPVLAIGLVLALGYASNPFSGSAGWREVPHFKWPVIALTWGIVTGWIPCEWGLEPVPNMTQWGHAIAQTCFVAGITLPFDVRDLDIDAPRLRTMPQVAGIRRTTWLALGLVLLSMIGFALMDPSWGRVGTGAVALFAIIAAERNTSEWIFSLWLDGCLLLQGILAFLTFPS